MQHASKNIFLLWKICWLQTLNSLVAGLSRFKWCKQLRSVFSCNGTTKVKRKAELWSIKTGQRESRDPETSQGLEFLVLIINDGIPALFSRVNLPCWCLLLLSCLPSMSAHNDFFTSIGNTCLLFYQLITSPFDFTRIYFTLFTLVWACCSPLFGHYCWPSFPLRSNDRPVVHRKGPSYFAERLHQSRGEQTGAFETVSHTFTLHFLVSCARHWLRQSVQTRQGISGGSVEHFKQCSTQSYSSAMNNNVLKMRTMWSLQHCYCSTSSVSISLSFRWADKLDSLSAAATQDPEGFLGHPVNAFKLMKRLNTEWGDLESLVLSDTTDGMTPQAGLLHQLLSSLDFWQTKKKNPYLHSSYLVLVSLSPLRFHF